MLHFGNGKTFSYEMIGEFRSSGEWIHPDRIISTYEIIFVISGTLEITEDGTEYAIGENEIIILEPNKRHYGTRVTDKYVSFYWFHFSTNVAIDVKTVKNRDVYDVGMLMKKLLHIANSAESIAGTADTLGFAVLSECLTEEKNENTLTSEIKEYVRNNLKTVSVSDTAKHFGYNSDYIGKMFFKNTGVRLKKYIDSCKLEKAKAMLLTTNNSVKEIAAALGYEDENPFIKFFIYHEKITPKTFGNKYFNTHINNR